MYLVYIKDTEKDECFEVYAQCMDDLQEIFDFLKMQPNLCLIEVESRFILGNLQEFKDLLNDIETEG